MNVENPLSNLLTESEKELNLHSLYISARHVKRQKSSRISNIHVQFTRPSEKKLIRILAGNPQLARSVRAYLRDRDRITNSVWKKDIRPLLQTTENAILLRIRSYSLSEWELSNLNNIRSQIATIVERWDESFRITLSNKQDDIATFSGNTVD